ncbi:MAG: hypothetical protein AVDCRST_MAG56-6093, partial [uncultured Cytophagales bacterium]
CKPAPPIPKTPRGATSRGSSSITSNWPRRTFRAGSTCWMRTSSSNFRTANRPATRPGWKARRPLPKRSTPFSSAYPAFGSTTRWCTPAPTRMKLSPPTTRKCPYRKTAACTASSTSGTSGNGPASSSTFPSISIPPRQSKPWGP